MRRSVTFSAESLGAFLYWMSLVAVSLSALVSGYHVFLGVVAAFPKRRRRPPAEPKSQFAILIPAHNEEAAIRNTIASCQVQDYPSDRFTITVIADNCTDDTVVLARKAGALCYNRDDRSHTGKGAALAWGIARVLPTGCDAIVVVDADCTLDSNALRELDQHITAGHDAVQLNNVPSNADDCAMSYLLALANKLENDLFYLPKDRLGMAVFLRGTGMMLSRRLLEACPWHAKSRAEDSEYSVKLLSQGLRIYFEHRAAVRSAVPIERGRLTTQRNRWIGGQLEVARSAFWGLLRGAVCKRDLRLLDAAWTGFVLVRVVVLAILLGTVILTGVAAMVSGDVRMKGLSFAALLSLGLFASYILAGMVAFGITKDRLRLLVGAVPGSVKYSCLALRACLNRDQTWKRTER